MSCHVMSCHVMSCHVHQFHYGMSVVSSVELYQLAVMSTLKRKAIFRKFWQSKFIVLSDFNLCTCVRDICVQYDAMYCNVREDGVGNVYAVMCCEYVTLKRVSRCTVLYCTTTPYTVLYRITRH